jgi:hypothetical protein
LKFILAASLNTGLNAEMISTPPFPEVSFCANKRPEDKILTELKIIL